jgi:DNA-binding protein YbaB
VTPDFSGPLPGPATPAVNAALRGRLEQLLGEYDRLRGNLATMQQRLASAQAEAKSDDGSVRVTVGPRGELRGLEIGPRAYRHLSPSELAAEILRLSTKATASVQDQLEEVMAPFLPAGVSYADAASGTADLSAWAPSRPVTNATFDDWIAGFGRSSPGEGQ